MLPFDDLNWLAVLVAALLSFALGGVWYGPLFGKAWLAALGKTEAELAPSVLPYVVAFVAALLTSIVLAGLIEALGIVSPVDGALLGLVTGIGFVAASTASDGAFCGWRPALLAIQSGYRVVLCVLMGIVLAWWQ